MTTIDAIKSTNTPFPINLGDGRTLTARALLSSEHRAIAEALPPPKPPLVKDPMKGTNEPRVPNLNDPEFQEADSLWWDRQAVVRVAVAIDLELPDGRRFDARAPLEARRDWLLAAETVLDDNLTKADMDSLRNAVAKPTLAKAIEETGEGNSGGGRTATPA